MARTVWVSNEDISHTKLNAGLDEIYGWQASANANSFHLSGLGTLTFGAAGGFPDGTSSLPSIPFKDDLNTGLYRIAADTIGLATGGAERVRIGASGVRFTTTTTTTTTLGGKDARVVLLNATATLDAGGEVVLGAVSDDATGRYAVIGSDIKDGSGGGDVYIATKSTGAASLTRALIVTSTGRLSIPTASTTYADNAAAISGGLTNGTVYWTAAGDLKRVV